jgi:hypothetical protein
MPQFEPSPASLTPKKKALLTLQYIRKAAVLLETYIETSGEGEELPTWVLTRVNQSGSSIGAAMGFLQFKKAAVPSSEKSK